jgi:hypothetical protein
MEPKTRLILENFVNTANEIIGENFDEHLDEVGMDFRINQQDDETYFV